MCSSDLDRLDPGSVIERHRKATERRHVAGRPGEDGQATLTIHCWDFEKAGRKSVKAIMSAIYDALHRQEASITVAGFGLTDIHFEFETTFQDTSEVGQSDHFYHGVQRFRALIETP